MGATAARAARAAHRAGASDVSSFIGTWKYVSGEGTQTCPTIGTTTMLSGVADLTITAGAAANTIVTMAAMTNCTTVFTVGSNGVATVNPGQSCTLNSTDSQTGKPIVETRTPNTDTLTVSNGTLMTNTNENDVLAEGTQSVMCTLSGMLSFMKL